MYTVSDSTVEPLRKNVPAHEMLEAAGVIRGATFRQHQREWFVDYVVAPRSSRRPTDVV